MITVQDNRIIYSGEVDERFAMQFHIELHNLEKQEESIDLVCIGSPGGSWEYGSGIMDAILTSKNYINSYGYGEICSTAALMFLAADYRIMFSNSYLMLHFGSISMDENLKDTKRVLEMTDYQCKLDCDFLSKRSNKPPSYWNEKLSEGDFYLTPEQAFSLEIIHEIR